ncbi:phosphorylase [Alcaligenaceae bacterium]|nr:phosphorylase [Alcaligenaceae bacterium]
MTTAFMQDVEQRSAAALASGDLQPIITEQTDIQDQGLPFAVHWVSTLAAKDASKGSTSVAIPGGPRDPDFNPFLKPDPALLLGPIGGQHVAILNKFPLCANHIVLATNEFQEQRSPLTLEDCSVWATIMSANGGLGFYNGGTDAGASQRHKHVQWLPTAPGNASLRFLVSSLPSNAPEHSLHRHPLLAFKHAFVRVQCGLGVDAAVSAASMYQAFTLACDQLGLVVDDQGLLSPCNVVVEQGWLLLVPRVREHVGDVSVNALFYGGTIYIRQPQHIEPVRSMGPLAVLAQVGVAVDAMECF